MKETMKYIIVILAIAAFGVFIYPTIYHFDKLEQKYPVKINRLTGEAQVLTSKGWIASDNYENMINEIAQYKNEISNQLANDRQQVKTEIIDEIKDDIVAQVKDDIASTKAEIESYKQYELDPNTYFTLGDSKDAVKKIMGSPDSVQSNDFLNQDTWFYGAATVTFVNGKVKEWYDYKDTLRTK